MGTKHKSGLTSKWIKTKVLMQSSTISPLIPETVKFSKANLKTMLLKYGMIYVKPEHGTYGNGVMKVEQSKGSHGIEYKYQTGTKIKTFGAYDTFYSLLKKATRGRSYLIQRGIVLLKHGKHRFDIRVMVQLSPRGKWETTGLIGRVAEKGKIVTNYHSGGKLTAMEKLLSPYLNEAQQDQMLKILRKLGEDTGRFYHKKYPGFKQIGVDVGLDSYMTPWIIEVNTNPDPYIFKHLPNKSMYRKVMAYRRANAKKKSTS
ncbi:YheC/YheD family protein [Paenibacillus sp.]|uniref:YheC/YheD family protein n=1 Tax=Paenibacillus sp. TaxID=58172 RepID=UPI0028A6697B|nr:YheC/YheD family protein [Paenibacillus sp.]